MIVAICPKCHSDDLTLPNCYRKVWKCGICGARFEKPKMVRVSISPGEMRELKRQAEAIRQELASAAEQYLRAGKI